MRVSREKVAENRARILDAAARLFREHGVEGVTVAQIMKAAGLTHGAFYGHFASKEDLVAAAFAHALDGRAASAEIDGLADYAAVYLSPEHLASVGGGCLFAALGTEAARGTPEVRRTMTEAIRRRLDAFQKVAPGGSEAERRRAAVAAWSAMVGALVLARISDDPELAGELLDATRATLAG